MAVTERLEGTRSGSIDPTGSRTVTRIFDVVGTDVLQEAIAEMDAHIKILNTYPIGTIYDFDEDAYVEATATYYGQKSWTHGEGTTDHWIFTLTYSTAPSAAGGSGGGGGSYITTQGDTNATTKAVYRVNVSAPSGDSPGFNDIGGTNIDVGGTKTSVVSMDRRFNTTVKLSNFPNVGGFSNLVGKRNSGEFEGGATGTILYIGFSWQLDESSGLWSVSHNFAVDTRTYHAEQVAKTDPQGEVILAESEGSRHAKTVFWVQPFPSASFSSLPQF
jgi:hypothetical protein